MMGRTAIACLIFGACGPAFAQAIDLSHGGPITITATDGLEWRQADQMVVARGSAKAVRGAITLDTDVLSARYRKKAVQPGAAPTPVAAPSGGAISDPAVGDGSSEIYRVEADGNVRVTTPTEHAEGDKAVYDMDQQVLVMTGKAMKITTPNDTITARDSLEYWSGKHMAVARGNAVVLTNDGRRIGADTLVAYTTDPATDPKPAAQPVAVKTPAGASADPLAAGSGQLKKVEAFGNVSIRTPTDIVTGDRAVYVPESGIARLAGHVRITRGQNQLNGTEAEVNLKTGISRLLSAPGERVEGLVLPNDPSTKGAALPGAGKP